MSAPPASFAYAHSLPEDGTEKWEPLPHHLEAVARYASDCAAPFGWAALAGLAGRLHDIGKLHPEFQAYIRGDRPKGGDHSSAGAKIAWQSYQRPPLGKILAAVVAAHHGGLADGIELVRRLESADCTLPKDWDAVTGPLPQVAALSPTCPHKLGGPKGFAASFLTRMVFSCLVDADFLETERFYAEAGGQPVERGGYLGLDVLRNRLRAHMAASYGRVEPTPLNMLRRQVLDTLIAKAVLPPGLFTLTVPTGGGKTLASLSFALEHAVHRDLRRVIYVIPFTSIIEQTAEVFRTALGTSDGILEHHASFDWDRFDRDGEGRDGLAKLRRAAENWEAPVVVTTAVQFFESLFANRPSRCRKLHNIAGSVVVLDEVQTLPLHLLRPCMAVLDELARNYRVSVVLCTATQPALREIDGFKNGFAIGEERELAPEPRRLYAALKRVSVEHPPEPVADELLAARFAEQPQMLCIVNSRAHARTLFAAIRHLPGAAHLTTLMCPRHRRTVLADLRARLANGQPVRLVATSLIEAGVDISFPEVWRAAAGLESVAQAAGRCNREGLPALGRVVVFVPAEAKPPHELKQRWEAAGRVFGRRADPLGLDVVADYFQELYWQRGETAFDTAIVDDRPGILRAIAERATSWAFPFAAVAAAFRMIDQAMEPVAVPWRGDPADDEAERLLTRIAAMDRPRAEDLRRLQQYVVPIPRAAREEWLATGVLQRAHPALGDAVLRFADLAHYDAETGVQLNDINLRAPEMNVIS